MSKKIADEIERLENLLAKAKQMGGPYKIGFDHGEIRNLIACLKLVSRVPPSEQIERGVEELGIALAAGAQRAETRETAAQSEGRQSGGEAVTPNLEAGDSHNA